jgi:aminopeptidase N
MARLRARLTIALTLAGILCLAPAAHAATGVGDPFFPDSGTPGVDIGNYDVSLSYDPGKNLLHGNETITATATEGLTDFPLDLYKLKVSSVSVDGVPAAFRRLKDKVDITPPSIISVGQQFTVAIAYHGHPGTIVDPDGSHEGWFRTGDGGVAFGEPLGTATWVPCNNSLTDKATWTMRVDVPASLHGAADGRLVGITKSAGRKTFTWRESQPMATYLAALDVGRGALQYSTSAGIPTWTAIDPRVSAKSKRLVRRLPEIIRFETKAFGPYPFDSAGAIIDPARVGYALETQTRPTYSFDTDLITIVHETAHQWFGDSVGFSKWPDIWLAEGFATWAEMYWNEKHGGPPARQVLKRYRRDKNPTLWKPPPARPGDPKYLFSTSTYYRGGMALEALREKIGTQTFLAILRDWTAQHQYGNATTKQFTDLAESVSGRDLGPFFQRWLYRRGKP